MVEKEEMEEKERLEGLLLPRSSCHSEPHVSCQWFLPDAVFR